METNTVSEAITNAIKMAMRDLSDILRVHPGLGEKERVGMFVTNLRRAIRYETAWMDLEKSKRKMYSRHLFNTKFWLEPGKTIWYGKVSKTRGVQCF